MREHAAGVGIRAIMGIALGAGRNDTGFVWSEAAALGAGAAGTAQQQPRTVGASCRQCFLQQSFAAAVRA